MPGTTLLIPRLFSQSYVHLSPSCPAAITLAFSVLLLVWIYLFLFPVPGTECWLSFFFSILPNIFVFLLLQKPKSFEIGSSQLHYLFPFPATINDLPLHQSPAFNDDFNTCLLFFISIPGNIFSDFQICLDDPFNT